MPLEAPSPAPTHGPATVDPHLTSRGYIGDVLTGQTRLDEAWRALQAEVSSVPARLSAGELDLDTVRDVLASAALRVLRNPDGYTEGSGAIDDYREDWKRSDASADMYFTAAELRRVSPDLPVGGWVGSLPYAR